MIHLTRLNGEKIMLNSDLIEFLEETPDTIISLTNGKKLVVKESAEDIRREVINFKREIFSRLKK